jgi:hypothetical protein
MHRIALSLLTLLTLPARARRRDNKPAIEVAPSCDGSLRGKKSSGEDAMPHGFGLYPS